MIEPEIKIFYIFKDPFFNSTTNLAFISVCVFDHLFDPLSIKLFEIYVQIWTLWVKAHLKKYFQANRTRIFLIFKDPFFNSATYLALMSVCVFDHFFGSVSIKLFEI